MLEENAERNCHRDGFNKGLPGPWNYERVMTRSRLCGGDQANWIHRPGLAIEPTMTSESTPEQTFIA